MSRTLAAFTMRDMEQLMYPERAEFKRRGKDKKKRKSRGMGLGAKVALGAGGLAAAGLAARYGGIAGAKGVMRGIKSGSSIPDALARGASGAQKAAAAQITKDQGSIIRAGRKIASGFESAKQEARRAFGMTRKQRNPRPQSRPQPRVVEID